MWDVFVQAVSWLLLIFFGGQALIFIGLVLWTIWTDAIRPRLIPANDIDRVAADIIATVAIEPTLESLAVLAGIVAIRTFLSLSLEVEVSGRWPWQQTAREVSERQQSQ